MDKSGEHGTVVSLEGQLARIQVSTTDSCRKCGARVICTPTDETYRTVIALNKIKAKVGDQVLFTETSNFLLKLSIFQYGIPLAGFFVGVFFALGIGKYTSSRVGELWLFLSGIIGVILGGLYSHRRIKKMAEGSRAFFKIQQVL
ncbi:MAG: SoxR reducing system RseC family protein [Candidatus Marinimicrobia bacterium]|nr:SoxR reducing system RseC family protein [Candidatus Neomarinimicrobiota bacterium]